MIAYKYNNKKKEYMGIMKEKYIEDQIKNESGIFDVYVDKIAEKVANESVDEDVLQEDEQEQEREVPQHVIDEAKVDEAIMRRHDLRQMEMYDDPYMNWSGHR